MVDTTITPCYNNSLDVVLPMITRRKATETELAYAAGVIDSDGFIGIGETIRESGTPRYTTLLTIVNTSTNLMDWLKDLFGGNVIVRRSYNNNYKTTYYWRMSDDNAAEVLKQVRPYLVIKTRQADLAIKFRQNWKSFRGHDVPAEINKYREDTYYIMQALNDDRRHLQRLSETAPGNGEAIVCSASKDAEASGTETTCLE